MSATVLGPISYPREFRTVGGAKFKMNLGVLFLLRVLVENRLNKHGTMAKRKRLRTSIPSGQSASCLCQPKVFLPDL